MTSTDKKQLGLREVLQIKAVRRLWLAQIISVFGDFLLVFAVLTYVSFNLHGTAVQVTGISISFLLPFAIIGPIVGVFVDRMDVKRTMIASDLLRSLLVLLLFFGTKLWLIYATLCLISVVSTFFIPAQTITIRTITPPEGLMSANALMQQAMQMVRIVTPALAGAMVGWFGTGVCYALDTVSFLVSAGLISTLVILRQPAILAQDSHPVKAVWNDLFSAMKFIASQATMAFAILAMTAGMFAISCFGPLIAVYVRDELKANELIFGLINSMIGVGMIAGSLVMGKLPPSRSKNHLVLAGLLIMSLFVFLLAALRYQSAATASMFGIGVGVVFVIISAQTTMQGQTPVEMIGRISSSVWSLLSIAQLFGLLLSGSTAQQIGITNVFYATGALLFLMTIFGFFVQPKPAAVAAK
jgi:MFS family permease